MGWFGQDSEEYRAHEEFQEFQPGSEVTEEHKAKFSHEFIGGAAAFAAMRAYEKHQEENGKPDNHAQAKEILAGLAGAFIDREVETKGLDFVDREKAKYHARQQLEEASAQDF
ncbi:hypothetical protein AtubIFM56815_004209 [Aspergillus tubingensis]|uniref:Uncharacterized protein n=2 Tax=Aspergillus subgen. Circumdati TaxID=2720871 RepID=A0A117E2N1_ASPNG|nr:hypothetical protein ASPNIDRAFT_50239 [Aspergillus niger]GLA89721.1 hypothetical protein AtubIFM56815_004209 [Aspergillus tubingensis]GLA98338.1 hypothetical protein AtubIFM57143_006279 [Aspergillus tubingensis]